VKGVGHRSRLALSLVSESLHVHLPRKQPRQGSGQRVQRRRIGQRHRQLQPPVLVLLRAFDQSTPDEPGQLSGLLRLSLSRARLTPAGEGGAHELSAGHPGVQLARSTAVVPALRSTGADPSVGSIDGGFTLLA